MKILVVGNGAREHTLVWKLLQSQRVIEIYCAPGNAGTAEIAQNLPITSTDIAALAKAAKKLRIDLVVVGPEAPLAEGIVDYFRQIDIPIFGSSKAATELESSKSFAKDLCKKYNIPCAESITFIDYEQALDFVQRMKPPIVVKADGLAAGKGVSVAKTMEEAKEALMNFMIKKTLKEAGERVVIEEFLTGREMSAFAFTDSSTVVPMVPACDYKRVYDGDRGPNTGGMGSYSPPSFYNPILERRVMNTVMYPTVKAMAWEGRPYRGVLYGGLMVSGNKAKVLEFNARFGDPETQVTLPRLKTDLVDIIEAVIYGRLDQIQVECSDDVCVGVVMSSEGYPNDPKTGREITGLNDVDKDIMVFHGGTKVGARPGEVLTSGGRVLTVVAKGKTLAEARAKVYDNISRIHFEGSHYRKDIAKM